MMFRALFSVVALVVLFAIAAPIYSEVTHTPEELSVEDYLTQKYDYLMQEDSNAFLIACFERMEVKAIPNREGQFIAIIDRSVVEYSKKTQELYRYWIRDYLLVMSDGERFSRHVLARSQTNPEIKTWS